MSFPEPTPPPLSYIQPPYHGGDGGFWPAMNNEPPNSNMRMDHYAPAYKRQRSSDSAPPNYPNHSSMNPHQNKTNTNMSINPDKGTCNIFFKTRICQRFNENNCRNGENCTFAHGEHDLRAPPPNWQDLLREREIRERGSNGGDWEDDQRIISRMKICRKFYNGEECPYGEKCNFLHESPMKYRNDNVLMPSRESAVRESVVISVVEQKNTNSFVADQQNEINRNLNSNANANALRMKPYWKTKLCSKFEMTGHCHYGDGCHYAHGQSDLQSAIDPNFGSVRPRFVSSVPSTLDQNNNHHHHTSNTDVAVNAEESEANKMKNMMKWKTHRKLNRIYADWIDEDPYEAQD